MAGPNISRWRIVLTSSLLFASGASAQDGAAQPIQLSSSLFFKGLEHVLPQSAGSGSRCQSLVQNALPYNQSSIMFVPNTYFEATTSSIVSQVLTLYYTEAGRNRKLFFSVCEGFYQK